MKSSERSKNEIDFWVRKLEDQLPETRRLMEELNQERESAAKSSVHKTS